MNEEFSHDSGECDLLGFAFLKEGKRHVEHRVGVVTINHRIAHYD